MAKTKLITVSSASPTAITTATACQKVTVGEDPSVSGYPTTDFLVMKPTSSDQARRVLSGNQYDFPGPRGPYGNDGWEQGRTVGYVKAVVGTTTFYQDEGP